MSASASVLHALSSQPVPASPVQHCHPVHSSICQKLVRENIVGTCYKVGQHCSKVADPGRNGTHIAEGLVVGVEGLLHIGVRLAVCHGELIVCRTLCLAAPSHRQWRVLRKRRYRTCNMTHTGLRNGGVPRLLLCWTPLLKISLDA